MNSSSSLHFRDEARAEVVRGALENAVGVAGTVLLAEATMIEVEDEAPPAPAMNLPMM